MRSLPETQTRLLDALVRSDRAGVAPAAALLRDAGAISASRRLQVYRHNVQASLQAALAAVYPVVARLVGAAFFASCARRFMAAHPSRSGNLHDFGRELPDFLRASPEAAGLPYLGDVADLEWACHEVYHEADETGFDVGELANVPAECQSAIRLALQPASRFVVSAYPVLAIWHANQAGADPEAEPVSLDDGGVRLLVARRDLDIEFRELALDETVWLSTLADDLPLETAVERALAIDPAFDLGTTLARHLALGTFGGWSIGDDAMTVGDGRGSHRKTAPVEVLA